MLCMSEHIQSVPRSKVKVAKLHENYKKSLIFSDIAKKSETKHMFAWFIALEKKMIIKKIKSQQVLESVISFCTVFFL